MKGVLLASALAAICASQVHAEEKYQGYPMGIITKETQIFVLNENGKRLLLKGLFNPKKLWEQGSFEKLDEGEPCKLREKAWIAIPEEVPPDTARVILVYPPWAGEGYCSLMVEGYLPYAEVVAAKKAFESMLPERLKKN